VDIRGRAAVVTGAAVGTGRAIACRLAAEGAAVVLADIDAAGCAHTERLIIEAGGRAATILTDLRSRDDVHAMIEFARSRLGGLHILVNNAGGGGHLEPNFPDATPQEWSALLELNLHAPMLATQLALPAMSEGGAVVNISSTAALGHQPYQSPEYAAAKAGLIRFTSALGGLRERCNVRVNAVVPDWMGTDRAYAELAELTAPQRATRPTPIALTVLTDAVVRLIRDEEMSGCNLVLLPGEPTRLLR